MPWASQAWSLVRRNFSSTRVIPNGDSEFSSTSTKRMLADRNLVPESSFSAYLNKPSPQSRRRGLHDEVDSDKDCSFGGCLRIERIRYHLVHSLLNLSRMLPLYIFSPLHVPYHLLTTLVDRRTIVDPLSQAPTF